MCDVTCDCSARGHDDMIAMETMPSAVAPDIAISIRNAFKEYGGGWTLNGKQQPIKVLKGLNMTVGSGTM